MSDVGTGLQQRYLLGTFNSDGVLVGVTTGTSIFVPQDGRDVTLYLRSIGTTSGGVVTIEEAGWDPREVPYSGTWSKIADINASTFSGGIQKAEHLSSPTPYQYVRVRISSDITGGGTVAVWMFSA